MARKHDRIVTIRYNKTKMAKKCPLLVKKTDCKMVLQSKTRTIKHYKDKLPLLCLGNYSNSKILERMNIELISCISLYMQRIV